MKPFKAALQSHGGPSCQVWLNDGMKSADKQDPVVLGVPFGSLAFVATQPVSLIDCACLVAPARCGRPFRSLAAQLLRGVRILEEWFSLGICTLTPGNGQRPPDSRPKHNSYSFQRGLLAACVRVAIRVPGRSKLSRCRRWAKCIVRTDFGGVAATLIVKPRSGTARMPSYEGHQWKRKRGHERHALKGQHAEADSDKAFRYSREARAPEAYQVGTDNFHSLTASGLASEIHAPLKSFRRRVPITRYCRRCRLPENMRFPTARYRDSVTTEGGHARSGETSGSAVSFKPGMLCAIRPPPY